MTNATKTFAILCISTFLFSCSKNDDQPTVVTTYKLTLKATIPTGGNTIFSSITYKKADGTTVTLNNTSTSFLESFDISSGFNIFFNVAGTSTSNTQPQISVNYAVEKFENNENKGITCYRSASSIGGTAGTWSFSSSNNFVFNGSSCN